MANNDLIQKIAEEMERKFGNDNKYIKSYNAYKPQEQPKKKVEHRVSDYVGIFEHVQDAIAAAKRSQQELMELSMKDRSVIIEAMRKAALENSEMLAILANEETGFGVVEDKIIKNNLAAEKTPGTEDLKPSAFSGDDGLTLVELAPYGVIGSITPSTNPSSTVINNSISMVAAGNGVVFNPHPYAKRVTNTSITVLNKAIHAAGGPKELLTAPLNPTLDSGKVIMTHKDVRILCVTGGEAVVEVAMKSGKKAIAAGPGNPPVIVDDTANIKKAARDIYLGASFDNNVLCIAEKEVFAFDNIASELKRELIKQGAFELTGTMIDKVTNELFTKNKRGERVTNRKYVGKSAEHILKACGIRNSTRTKLIIAEVRDNHPFVTFEMLMPVLPIVRVRTIDEAIEKAVIAEADCHHTAIMHSENVTNLTKAARALDTSIFVKNAPSYAGLGIEGEGFTTLTIATPTGEGLTSARSFTRIRRCTLSGGFRIV